MGKAEKTHRQESRAHPGYAKCGIFPNDKSILKRDWRGVTCKNCLKKK